MKTYLLIMLLSYGNNTWTVNTEFSSYENCEKARLYLVEKSGTSSFGNNDRAYTIRAQGCFMK